MNDWYKNPTVLIVGAVVLVAGYVLLKNQNTTQTTTTSTNTTTTPVGQSYSYLDGNGTQHLIATDPNGALTSYNYPNMDSQAQTDQLGSYVGMLGPGSWVPYGGYTPSYSTPPVDPGNFIGYYSFPNKTQSGTSL